MLLSEWRAIAPSRDAMGQKVLALLREVLAMFGTGADPECWVDWGEDPSSRWAILVPVPAGLVVGHVRVSLVERRPRVTARLVRWRRVEHGEFTVETTDTGRRLISGSIERVVLRGVDADADRVASFLIHLYDVEDGRPLVPSATGKPRSRTRAPARASRAKAATATPARARPGVRALGPG